MSNSTENLGLFQYDPVADGKKKFNITTGLNENWSKIDEAVGSLASRAGIPPSNCKNLRMEKEDATVKLYWKDPSDTVVDDQILCTWGKTILVRKAGSIPETISDGTIILENTSRNAYNLTPFVDQLPDTENEYFYRLFPVSANGVISYNSFNKFGKNESYEFVIDPNNALPSGRVSYPEGSINEKFTPAGMDYSSNTFNYGSWADAFFMNLFKPCMLKYDGTVDYYLDPNDYSKKIDGTASDVANTAYQGNAMVEIGQIWIKEEEINGKIHVSIANKQIDEDYDCYTHIKRDGTYNEVIYRSIYDGCNISNKIRSLSGQAICKNVAGDTQITYAKANGSGWNIDQYNLRRLINYLLILIGKSTDSQTVFGTGRFSGGSQNSNNQLNTGTLDKKGMFYGDNNNGAVKVFHIENWWGNIWKITNGLIQNGGKLLYKMCEGLHDGSTVEEYNSNGSGYIDSGVVVSGTVTELYIKTMQLVPKLGLVPTAESGGSSSTYYCDGFWSNSTVVGFARFGSGPNGGLLVGAFAFNVYSAVSDSVWGCGVSLSYSKPL